MSIQATWSIYVAPGDLWKYLLSLSCRGSVEDAEDISWEKFTRKSPEGVDGREGGRERKEHNRLRRPPTARLTSFFRAESLVQFSLHHMLRDINGWEKKRRKRGATFSKCSGTNRIKIMTLISRSSLAINASHGESFCRKFSLFTRFSGKCNGLALLIELCNSSRRRRSLSLFLSRHNNYVREAAERY